MVGWWVGGLVGWWVGGLVGGVGGWVGWLVGWLVGMFHDYVLSCIISTLCPPLNINHPINQT